MLVLLQADGWRGAPSRTRRPALPVSMSKFQTARGLAIAASARGLSAYAALLQRLPQRRCAPGAVVACTPGWAGGEAEGLSATWGANYTDGWSAWNRYSVERSGRRWRQDAYGRCWPLAPAARSGAALAPPARVAGRRRFRRGAGGLLAPGPGAIAARSTLPALRGAAREADLGRAITGRPEGGLDPLLAGARDWSITRCRCAGTSGRGSLAWRRSAADRFSTRGKAWALDGFTLIC